MKVLIVDNSKFLQAKLINALRKVDENMSISKTGSCKEAFDLFSPFKPHKVILDMFYLM